MGVYDYTVTNRDGSTTSLADFKGKVLLIVNTATGCGFTPQYDELERLYAEYRDKGFEILDFPCNQFLGQAPGSDDEIHQFCTMKFGTEFPQFKKIDVNGAGLQGPGRLRGGPEDADLHRAGGSRLGEQRRHQVELHQVPRGPRGQRRGTL
jgi:hypothetical protein